MQKIKNMKTLKINTLSVLMNLILMAIMLPACSQSSKDPNNTSKVDTPEMDIHAAVLSNNLEVVRQHIEAGTDLDEKEPFGGSTPLISAATFGKTEIAKTLIDAGADLTISNNDGSTPLHSAAFFCRVEIVQMLIDAKADKTLRNKYGATPREIVMGPFSDLKPVYEMMQQQLSPLGLQLDMAELEKTRPVIAMMLQ
jgi:ankyrin repeat protein